MVESNWNNIRQDLVKDIASFTKNFFIKASSDIKERLEEKGIPSNKLSISSNHRVISMKVTDKNEFEEGKIYFEQVYDEISSHKWLENI